MVLLTERRIAGDTVQSHSPPTLDLILSLVKDYQPYYREFHKQCQIEDDYYYLRRDPPMPIDFPADAVKPATARAIVDVATDHVDVRNFSIDVPAVGRATARAEKLKKFYQGAWLNIKEPVLREAVKQAFAYGISWVSPRFKSDVWYDAPKIGDFGDTLDDGTFIMLHEAEWHTALESFLDRRKLTFPLTVRNVNPQELIWDDSVTGPKWVIRIVQGVADDLRRRYPEWGKQSRLPGHSVVNWVEYWDDTYYAYLADNQFVMPPTRHGYGFMPFVPVSPANTLSVGSGKPEMRYQGILNPVHSLLDAEMRIMTQAHSILRAVSWRTLDFKGTIRQAEATRDEYEIFSGMNVVPEDVVVTPSPMVQIPPDLNAQLVQVQSAIEEATFPNVVRGIRPRGVGAGFAISALAGMGRLRFLGVAEAMAHAIEQVNMGWAKLVENYVQGPVTVHARSEIHNFDQTITPDDIKSYYENKVILKAEAPEEREREALLARQLYSQKMISLYEAQRRIGIVNPLDEQNRMAAEEMLAQMRPAQLEELVRRLGKQQVGQLVQAGDVGQVPNVGNQFVPGLQQLQRPGEGNIQRGRVQSRAGQPSVFPRGVGGSDLLGRVLSTPGGGGTRVPSGQTVG